MVGCGVTVMIGREDTPLYFKVAFAAIALWLPVAKLGLRRLTVRSTEYALTDRRLLMTTTPFRTRHEHTVYLEQIGPPDLIRHDDDHGTITFAKPTHFGRPRGTRPEPGEMISLEWITRAETVRDLILAAKAGRA